MATKQEFLDDLERRGLVRAVTGPDGVKTYTVPASVSPPAYYSQPWIPEQMSPEQWRDLVAENFRTVYLEWWAGAFQALLGVNPQAMANTIVPVYNPDTQLWETAVVPISGT